MTLATHIIDFDYMSCQRCRSDDTLTLARLTAVQNICPIYNKVGQQFCDFFISQWGLSAPTAKLDLWSSLLTFGRVGVNSTLLSLNRSLPPSVIQWYRLLLWSNLRVFHFNDHHEVG